jgi:hypothetical protein
MLKVHERVVLLTPSPGRLVEEELNRVSTSGDGKHC